MPTGLPTRGPAILDGRPGAETLSLIARQEIEYLRPIPYGRQPLDCEVWIARLGGASLDVHYEVFSPEGVEPRVLTTRAASTLVLVDAATQKPRRISQEERAAWSPYLEDPVTFTPPALIGPADPRHALLGDGGDQHAVRACRCGRGRARGRRSALVDSCT